MAETTSHTGQTSEGVLDDPVGGLLASVPDFGAGDTAAALVEIYESIERTYRAATMAGYAPTTASSTTAL